MVKKVLTTICLIFLLISPAIADDTFGVAPSTRSGEKALGYYWNDTDKEWQGGGLVGENSPSTTNGKKVLLYAWDDVNKKWKGARDMLSIGDTIGSGTPGSVLFVDAGGNLGEDNNNFFWDDSNNRLGIGTSTVNYMFTVGDTSSNQWIVNDNGELIDGDISNGTLGLGAETLNQWVLDVANKGIMDTFGVTTSTGLQVDWGDGEVYDQANELIVDVNSATSSCTDGAENHLIWSSGNSLSLGIDDAINGQISVAHVGCQNGIVWELHEEPGVRTRESDIEDALEKVFPVTVSSGLIVEEDTDATNAFDVILNSGTYYHDMQEKHPVDTVISSSTFMYLWFHTSGSWDFSTSTQIDITQYDNGTDLTALSANRYAKSCWFVVDNPSGASQLHWIYPTSQHVVESNAIAESCPTRPPGLFRSPYSTGYIVKEGDSAFVASSDERWTDERPIFGITTGGLINDHSALINLSNDDHLQYLLTNGTRALTGDWGVGGTYGIENINTLGVIGTSSFVGITSHQDNITLLDNKSILFGAEQDAGITYNGTDLIADFDILNAGTADFRVQENGVNMFVVKGNGNVGIGVDEPSARFEIVNFNTNTQNRIKTYSDNVAHAPIFDFYKSHTDSEALVETIDEEQLGKLQFAGVDGSNTQRNSAKMIIYQNGAASGDRVPADIVFQTESTLVNSREVLRIDKDTNVLMNNDNAIFKLGAVGDAGIYYDNTDLIIDPDLVGSGLVKIGATGDNDLEARRLGLGATIIPSTFENLLRVEELAVSTALDFQAVRLFWDKVSGSTSVADDFFSMVMQSDISHVRDIGDYKGIVFNMKLTGGHVGSVATTKNMEAFTGAINISGGRVDNANSVIRGGNFVINLDSGAVAGDVRGVEIWVDDDIGAGGDVTMLYLEENTGVDYGIYQNGTADNYFGGDVGIGITDPDGTLHVNTATAGSVTAQSGADDLVVENSGNSGISILTPTSSVSSIFFGSPDDNIGAAISYQQSVGLMKVGTNSTGGQLIFLSDNVNEAARFDASGNFGIGTTNPDSLLHIQEDVSSVSTILRIINQNHEDISGARVSFKGGTGATTNQFLGHLDYGKEQAWTTTASTQDSYIQFHTRLNGAGNEVVRISSDGNVGIGTNNPSGILHTAKSAASSEHFLDTYSTNNAQVTRLKLRKSASATIGTPSETADGEAIGDIEFFGGDNTNAFDYGARIRVIQDGASGVKVPSNMILTTYSSTAENTNQLVLHNDGNVGIGTTGPDSKLHVYSASAGAVSPAGYADEFILENNSNVGMSLFSPNANVSSIVFGSPADSVGAILEYQNSTGLLKLGTHLPGGQVAFRSGNNVVAMTIDASGDVGIGTTTPTELLTLGGSCIDLQSPDGSTSHCCVDNVDGWTCSGI